MHRALELMVEQRNRRDTELRHKWSALGHGLDDLHADDVMRRAWT